MGEDAKNESKAKARDKDNGEKTVEDERGRDGIALRARLEAH